MYKCYASKHCIHTDINVFILYVYEAFRKDWHVSQELNVTILKSCDIYSFLHFK